MCAAHSLVKFYSDALGLDNTTHSLLKSETYLNATQAKDLGFATMLQVPQKSKHDYKITK
jgi:hypothetical protein